MAAVATQFATRAGSPPVAKEPPQFSWGDRVKVSQPDGYGGFWEHDFGYVRGHSWNWEGRVCYDVFLPKFGCAPNFQANRLRADPEPTPVLYRKMYDGTLGEIEYRTHRTTLRTPEGKPTREWSLLHKAFGEAWELVTKWPRGLNGTDPEESEYWVGLPAGTCYVWHQVTPRAVAEAAA